MKDLSLKSIRNAAVIGFVCLLLASCSSSQTVEGNSAPETTSVETPEASDSPNTATGKYISIDMYEASPAAYTESQVVLFFNAAWCSTCKVARDNFEATLSDIPEDLTVVVVDFDDSNELRKKYGVTVQHTFVQIDANGDEVKKWSGSTTFDEVVDQTV
jgi:thiol-disulfide isomerase/thioredoxin